MEIKPILNNIAKNTVNTFNEVGSFTVNKATLLKNNIQDKFIKSSNGAKILEYAENNGIGKETFIGAGVATAGVILAIKCIKGINHSIKGVKK